MLHPVHQTPFGIHTRAAISIDSDAIAVEVLMRATR
jgi:hypothetical protein